MYGLANVRTTAIAGLWGLLALTGAGQAAKEDDFRSLLRHGFELHQQAKFVDAIPVLERAWRLDRSDYFANLLLGIDLLRTDRAAKAIGYLQAAARAKPNEDAPEEYLGEAQARLGHFDKAADAYMEGVKRGGSSEDALLAWAGFCLERFRQIGEELRSSDAGTAMVRRLQSEATKPVAELTCPKPIPALESLLASSGPLSDSGLQMRHDLSLCYAIKADSAVGKLNTITHDLAGLHRLRGDVLLRLSNDAAGASSEYKQAIALRANDPALYERLAESQISAGNQDEAKRSALMALEIDPHRTAAMGTLARMAMNDRDYQQALTWLEKMRADAPRDRNVQVELAKAQAQTDKPAEALANLKDALAEGYPDEKGALHSLEARLLRILDRNTEAAKASEEAKRLSDAFQRRNRGGTMGKSDANQ